MEKLETEVKFHLSNLQSLRKRISDLGARSRGRFFERNHRYEDSHKSLEKNKFLLRLRQDEKNTLTIKSPASEHGSQFKKMRELEVEVSDFNTMNSILEALGFHCEQIYEKWREILVLERTLFCMDSMPFGNFLEIEGQEDDIKRYALLIGLQWKNRILLNYLEIFDLLRKDMNLNFRDVTFDNFKNIEVEFVDYLNLVKANSNR